MTRSLFGLLLLALLAQRSFGSVASFAMETVCDSDSEYFDSTSLSCRECTEDCSDDDGYGNCNKVPDTSVTDVYGNAIRCTCDTGYKRVELDCAISTMKTADCVGFECVSCLNGTVDDDSLSGSHTVAYEDGDSCTMCGNSTSGVDGTDCTCPSDDDGFTMMLTDMDVANNYRSSKACLSCADGTAVVISSATIAGVDYTASDYECQRCPDPHMSFDSSGSSCSCDSDYTEVGQSAIGPLSCVYTTYADEISTDQDHDETASSVVYYWKVQSSPQGSSGGTESLDSLTLLHYFLNASALCYLYSGPDSLRNCQVLGNLCVLQLYNPSTDACDLFEDTVDLRDDVSGQSGGWVESLPWLKYTDTASSVRENTDIGMTVSFGGGVAGATHLLQFYLSRTTMNGTWLGYEQLTTQFFYCGTDAPNTGEGGGTSSSTKWQKFGTSFKDSFTCDLKTLIDQDQVFYELFLLDESTDELFPVPVLLRDYKDSNGEKVNRNFYEADEVDDVFVRRFMLADAVSGITDSSSTDDEGYFVPQVVRYAHTITLRIESQGPKGAVDKIFPPVLEITYRERKTSAWDSNSAMQTDQVLFKVEYSLKDWKMQDWTIALYSTCICLSGILAAVRYLNWSARNSRLITSRPVDGTGAAPSIGEAAASYSLQWYLWSVLMIIAHSFTLVMFPFCFAYATWWFVFFKMQDTVYVLLPPEEWTYEDDDNYYFWFWVTIYCLFFFQSAWILHLIYIQCQADVFFIDMERPRSESQAKTPVSVWRSIFVANEWNEMQTSRPTSLALTLVFMGFVLIGQRLQWLGTPQPDIYDRTAGHQNLYLRFANHTWWLLLCEVGQLLFNVFCKYFVRGREDRGQQFIDLCTVAKVSVLVRDENYHGYLLYCDAPMKHADTSMEEITKRLLDEFSGGTTDRGHPDLASDGPFSNVQAFEVFLTDYWLRWFNAIRRHLDDEVQRAGVRGGDRDRERLGLDNRYINPRQAKRHSLFSGETLRDRYRLLHVGAMEVINEGLRRFIQRELHNELHWDAAEPLPWQGQLLRGVPRNVNVNTKCHFMPDTFVNGTFVSPRFTGVHFYGIEWDLWLHNTVVFAMFDVWFDNTAVSILAVFVIHEGLRFIRGHFGTTNVARRSLVDSTFLM